MFEYLRIIDVKVSGMPQVQVQVSSKFLPTLKALNGLGGSATTMEVSRVTGRARAAESAILNELAGRGLLLKEKQGHKRLFRVRDYAKGKTMDR